MVLILLTMVCGSVGMIGIFVALFIVGGFALGRNRRAISPRDYLPEGQQPWTGQDSVSGGAPETSHDSSSSGDSGSSGASSE